MGGLLNSVIGAHNLEEKRKQFKKLEKRFPAPRWAKITTVHTSSFNGELILAPNSHKSKALLYLHGGGFVFDATKLYRDLIARLARATELTTLSVDYSLAPEHPYPTALNEVFAAYRWLLKQGYKSDNIALGGDSAEGALALSLLHKLREQKVPMPACVFVMSPATDATFENTSLENTSKDIYISVESLRFFTESYLGDTSASDPIASPLLGKLEGFPPLLMHVDKNEIMYNDTAQFAAKAREAGVSVELHESNDLFHVWHIFARYMPEAKQAINDIGRFVKKHISQH
jgi:acetyl esterase/lipase